MKRNITRADLEQNASLELIFKEAVMEGLVEDSDADRLNFWTAAEEALTKEGNCAGLFVWFVKNRHWDRLKETSEEKAHGRLLALLGRAIEKRKRVSDEENTEGLKNAYFNKGKERTRSAENAETERQRINAKRDQRIVKAEELSRRGAWVIDQHGRRWDYTAHGLYCKDVNGIPFKSPEWAAIAVGACIRPYDDWKDHLEALNAVARLPEGSLITHK